MAVLRQPARLLLVVIAGLALGVAIDVVRAGGPQPWLVRHGIHPPAAIVGAGVRVDVGGHELYIDCRGAGSPT
ncbi:MAG TPA: hypothetical protein VIB02_11825, partial [Candidatus Limnocylindrales bacterium]